MSINKHSKILTNGLITYLDASYSDSYPGSGNFWYNLVDRSSYVTKAGMYSPYGSSTTAGIGLSDYPRYSKFNNYGYFSFIGGTNGEPYSIFKLFNVPSFSALSLFIWFRTSGTISSEMSLVRMDNSDFDIGFITTNSVRFSAGTNYNDVSVTPNLNNNIFNNAWHYAGLTFNGTVLNAYYDGILVGTTTRGSSTTTAAGQLNIGTRDDQYAAHYVGDISSIKLYNIALSNNDILFNYLNTKNKFGL